MLACHAGGPGSIPGRCKDDILLALSSLFNLVFPYYAQTDAFDVGKFYTFAEVYLFSHAFATALHNLSINPRDVVFAAIPQSIQAPIVLFGTWLRGAALSAVNPVYNPGVDPMY